MRFHLNFNPETSAFTINHKHSVFLIGSCFSDNIGRYLNDRRFKIHSNPAGNLFNPFSIADHLSDSLSGVNINESCFIHKDGTYYDYKSHSSLNASTAKELSLKLKTIQEQNLKVLSSCQVMFITFGTAFYYHHKELNITVANCHKQASSTFEKKIAKVEAIIETYNLLLTLLKSLNPKLKIVFTVSPVKHLKDGLIENALSKSTLLLAVHELVAKHEQCTYFPAYELVTDDLRDYRFYKEDLAHPNDLAIHYVWEKFSNTFFESDTLALNLKLEKLNLALNHRRTNSSSSESNKFSDYIKQLEAEIEAELPQSESK